MIEEWRIIRDYPIYAVSNLGRIGERNPNAKFTANDILKIRKMREEGISIKDIAKQFNTKEKYLYKIINRERWAWLSL
jgi:DNA invertase Pin-like site-specific DNA recombinase